MTPQEIFDISVKGVISQGGPSVDENGTCCYRGPNGRKCSAGWLIPDELYDPSFEKKVWYDNPTDSDLYKVVQLIGHTNLVEQLQAAHDDFSFYEDDGFWSGWKSELNDIATTFNLNKDVLDEIPV